MAIPPATEISGKTVYIGNCGYTLTGLTIERCRDRDTGDTVEITYEVPEDDAMASTPPMSSKVSVLNTVTLAKAVITPGTAGISTVKLTYNKPPAKDEPDDGDDGGSGGSEDGGDNAGGEDDTSQTTSNYHTNLDITVVDQPILSHPKIAGAGADKLEYLKALLDGARVWELVPVVDADGKPKRDKNGKVITRQLGKLLPGGKATELINKGVTSYKDIMGVYTETKTSRSGKVDIDNVGTIDVPPNAPKFKNRNWLLIARNASLNDDEKTYTISSTWMMSGLGGWDEDLYGG